MNNCAEYTVRCKHYFHVKPEITDEMTKNFKRREILSKYLQQLVEKWNSATHSNRKHQEQDKSINVLILPSILSHCNTITCLW